MFHLIKQKGMDLSFKQRVAVIRLWQSLLPLEFCDISYRRGSRGLACDIKGERGPPWRQRAV